MKFFIRDIIIVIFLIIIGFIGLEILMTFVENEYTYKRNYMDAHKNDIKFLILGHSHTGGGINPILLGDSVFNFAISSRPIYYDAQLAKRYVPYMHNLRTIIISHSYDCPWGYLSPNHPYDIPGREMIIFKYNKYMNISFDNKIKHLKLRTALFSNNMIFENFKNGKIGIDSYDSLGFYWRNKDIHVCDSFQCVHNVHIDGIGEDSLRSHVREYIRDMMDIAKVCSDNNVRLIAVTTPCYDSYIKQTNDIGLKTLYEIIDSVQDYYPIEYYNYLSDKEFSSDSLFYDSSHLNYIGAEKFTLRLKRDLNL